jgi:thioredoxin reductase
MAEKTSVDTSDNNARDEEMFPTLTAEQISRIAAHGHRRRIAQHEVLVNAGEQVTRLFVVTSGQLEAVRVADSYEKGFIKTGPDLSPEDLASAHWPLARAPHLLETSLPGVFAVGDCRGGSLKRVASAVGEGSIAVAFVHRVLHE